MLCTYIVDYFGTPLYHVHFHLPACYGKYLQWYTFLSLQCGFLLWLDNRSCIWIICKAGFGTQNAFAHENNFISFGANLF